MDNPTTASKNSDAWEKLPHGWARRTVSEVSPPTITGAANAGEIPTPDTATAKTVLNFPAGLKAISIDFHNEKAAQAAGNATVAYIAFNNSLFNDVDVAGLRKVVPIGRLKSFKFSRAPYPTSVTITTDAFETAAGDTAVSWEAVSYE